MKLFFNINFIGLTLILALSALASPTEAFTASLGSNMPIVGSSLSSRSVYGCSKFGPSTELQARRDDISNDERGSNNVNNLIGIDRGMYLGAIVVAINIWLFSIPVEFRRARMCTEAETIAYPTRCMTPEQWRTGITEYYKNGGGIKFDFSIEGRE